MGDNPIDFLMGLTKEVTGALRYAISGTIVR